MAGPLADEGDEQSEINVTPFIDVMLVLLIVFMVAAPLSTVDVAVNLPSVTAPPAGRPEDTVWLTVTASETVMLDEGPVDPARLAAALDSRTAGRRDTPVFLRADRTVEYGAVMRVLDALRVGGYLKVALVGLETPP